MSGTEDIVREKKKKKHIPTLRELPSVEETAEHTVPCFDRGRTEESLLNQPGVSEEAFAAETRSELILSPEVQMVKLREVHTISKQT